MLILSSRFIVPIYLVPVLLYFFKFFFIFVVMFAVLVMICSSTSAWKVQHVAAARLKAKEEPEGLARLGGQHYTNTWVSFIEGGSRLVHRIADVHGYVVLKEVSDDAGMFERNQNQ